MWFFAREYYRKDDLPLLRKSSIYRCYHGNVCAISRQLVILWREPRLPRRHCNTNCDVIDPTILFRWTLVPMTEPRLWFWDLKTRCWSGLVCCLHSLVRVLSLTCCYDSVLCEILPRNLRPFWLRDWWIVDLFTPNSPRKFVCLGHKLDHSIGVSFWFCALSLFKNRVIIQSVCVSSASCPLYAGVVSAVSFTDSFVNRKVWLARRPRLKLARIRPSNYSRSHVTV